MARVIVLGSSGFDLTIRLPRLPQPGETLLGGTLHTGPGGKGANSAVAARRAGAEVVFLSAFGDDDFGRQVYDNARREGLDLGHSRTFANAANQVALIFVGQDGRNLIGVAPGASGSLSPEDIDRLPEFVFEPSAVFLASLEVPLETVARGLERASRAGMTTILNPAPADRRLLQADILRYVSILTPNQEEARGLTGLPADWLTEAEEAANALIGLGANDVVLTLGESGCLVVAGGRSAHVPAVPVDVVDTVGAGDAFNGALAVALAEGKSLLDAARWACAAGAFAVTRPGAQGRCPPAKRSGGSPRFPPWRIEMNRPLETSESMEFPGPGPPVARSAFVAAGLFASVAVLAAKAIATWLDPWSDHAHAPARLLGRDIGGRLGLLLYGYFVAGVAGLIARRDWRRRPSIWAVVVLSILAVYHAFLP